MRGLCLLFSLVVSVDAAAAVVRCDVQTKHQCTPDGCEPLSPATWALLDARAGTYARCDDRGCDEYAASYARAGDFVTISLPERGMLAKLSVSDGRFLEVATIGTTALTSFGACAIER